MLKITNLTYRIGNRLLLDEASASLPADARIGLIGRNGAGKSTLLALITHRLEAESGSIEVPRRWRIGQVAQEAPDGPASLVETVLAADTERVALMTEAETCTDAHRIAEIETRLADMGAHAAPARAARILRGLGFTQSQQEKPVGDLSGGWRMRVALAAALFAEPDLLLLDEPTNYLDLEGTLWLESYLKTYPHTALIVSHDRDILNSVVEWTLHLDKGKLTLYRGGYDQFERQRAERMAQAEAAQAKQDAQRKHIQAFVDRFRAKASKARQAQSRLKALAKLTPITAIIDDPTIPIRFPEPAPAAPPLITFEQVDAGYAPGKPVLRDINLRLDQDDRIALLGSNGNGKSTFAKLLAGTLKPLSGEIIRARKLKVGYFAQHQLDALHAKETPYQHLRRLMPEGAEYKVRAVLGGFGFSADKANRPVETLSGGEKTRLLLALCTFDAPELLVLDEPTNHLDIDSREALVYALNDFKGAVLLISHDRHLIEATAERLWLVSGGRIAPWEDDLEAYRRYVISGSTEPPRPARPQQNKAEARKEAVARREKLKPLKQKIDALEKDIARLTQERDALDAVLADAELYEKDPKKAEETSKRRGTVLHALAGAEERWLEASAEYDTVQHNSTGGS
jgi:ATP-binding cassette subfamily F protein 3